MIVTYNGKESEKECACVCICMCTAESLCCISETSTTPKSTILQLKKKKTYEEKYRKTKKHNSSFYLSVITWNVNYSGWRKSFQVENSKGLNFLGQVNWKVNIKIKTNKKLKMYMTNISEQKAKPSKVCNSYKSLKLTKLPREKVLERTLQFTHEGIQIGFLNAT